MNSLSNTSAPFDAGTLKSPPLAAQVREGAPAPRARLFGWLKNLLFIAMNLSCLAIFFVTPDLVSAILFALFFVGRMLGVTAGYHRLFRASARFKTSRWFQFALACVGCSSMQKGPLWWVSQHRLHHEYTDQKEDPHSPIVTNFWSGPCRLDYERRARRNVLAHRS